jgi:DNA repair and recombination protein RAD52
MFNENQLKELSKNLDKSRIKIREKSGISLQYLETYDVINEANRIFNHMWSYTITRLEEVARETNQNSNHVITFSAIVKIKIYDSTGNLIEREDTGVGIGTARTIGDAIDNASKSAVSDSLKRCFRTMGVTFGNNLYSKSQNENHQNQNYNQNLPQNNQQQQQAYQNANVNHQTKTPIQQNKAFEQYEYDSLYRLNLQIVENNGFLIVTGDDIFSKKDSIKACGFKFDSKSKTWYKAIEQKAS